MEIDYSKIGWGDSLPQTLGGRADASSQSSSSYYYAKDAFNGNLSSGSSNWRSVGSTNEWISYTFDNKQSVNMYRIRPYPYVNDREFDPKTWDFQGLGDDGEWITLDSRENEIFMAGRWYEYRFENKSNYIAYRLYIYESNGGNIRIQEIEMYSLYLEGSILSSNNKRAVLESKTSDSLPQTLGGTANASSQSASSSADGAFNGILTGTSGTARWQSTGSTNEWISYTFDNKQSVNIYRIRPYHTTDRGRDPKTWDFQGLSDNGEWITLDSREDESFVQGEWNTYRFKNRFNLIAYRLYIYESNGSNIFIQEIEMYNENSILTVAPQSMQDELLVSQLQNYTEPKDPINLKQGINKINYINNEPAPLGDGIVFEQEIDVPIQKLEVK